jgi:hypothetical protein
VQNGCETPLFVILDGVTSHIELVSRREPSSSHGGNHGPPRSRRALAQCYYEGMIVLLINCLILFLMDFISISVIVT